MMQVRIVAGLLLAAIGTVAVVTADFSAAGSWLFAGALALLGVAGLVSAFGVQR